MARHAAMRESTESHFATAIWLDRSALDLTVAAHVGVGRVEAVTAADGHRGVERLPAAREGEGSRLRPDPKPAAVVHLRRRHKGKCHR